MPLLRSLPELNVVLFYRHDAPAGAYAPDNTRFILLKTAGNLSFLGGSNRFFAARILLRGVDQLEPPHVVSYSAKLSPVGWPERTLLISVPTTQSDFLPDRASERIVRLDTSLDRPRPQPLRHGVDPPSRQGYSREN